MDRTSKDHRTGFFYLLVVGKQVVLKPAYLWPCAQPDAAFAGRVVEIGKFNEFGLMATLLHNCLDHSVYVRFVVDDSSTEPNNLQYLPPTLY
jgi:hypothetical protein